MGVGDVWKMIGSSITSVNVLVLLATILVVSSFPGAASYEILGDLSSLQNQFQSFITEFESEEATYDTSIARLLEKLDLLQYSPYSHPNLTLDWFTPSKDIPTHPPLRIFIVVSSFEGIHLNSGIGTFYSSLSDFLIQRGHSVTILYTDTAVSDTPTFTRWKTLAEKRGLRATRLGPFPIDLRLSPLAQRSYQVYEFLKARQNEFDLVHFPDWEGPGYYTMLAKKDGIAFASKLFVVGIHGPWRWVKAANNPNTFSSTPLASADDMETDWMERKSVEMGDMVWSPSSDIVTWLGRNGWALPSSNAYRMPYLPGREVSQKNSNKAGSTLNDNINEIVFFGRMETRKGLELFADALDRLAVTRPEFAGTKVTFLGRSANIGNLSATNYLDDRFVKGAWPFKIAYISHKDRKAALEYLSEPTRVAVIPSIVDNTPYTVYECLFSRIPFIASDIPSIASLIDATDRDDVLFEVNAISLASKLEAILDDGAKIAKSSFKLEDVEVAWRAFYANAYQMITEQRDSLKQESELKASTPLVSVCITHYNRPHFLKLALESVEAQSYTNYEVILVDDGSTAKDAKDYLESLRLKFGEKGWKLILSTNQYLGAARNKAAQNARGEYLFFLDDDNLATPQLLSTYTAVAARSHADVLSAAHDVFTGVGTLEEGTVVGRWVPLGASPSLGIFKNCFGDANFFIKKSVFVAQKGFTEDRGVGQEDHEFLAKAVLDGRSLIVVPEPLLSYRMHNQSEQMLYTTDSLKNALRAHRPYRSLMEESGIEIAGATDTTRNEKTPDSFKLLAYSRMNSRQTSSNCNLTVTNLTPNKIPSRTSYKLTFTTAARDCNIQAIQIGDTYSCTINSVMTSTFTCTTPAIPVNGIYPIYVLLEPETSYRDTGTRLTVTPTPSTDTMVLVTLSVYIAAGQFNANQLLSLLAASISQSVAKFAMISDSFTGGTKRDISASDELHTSLITITSGTPSASDLYSQLFSALMANASKILPYRFYTLQLNAGCTTSGECSCGPSFTGVGCTTRARCPSDCSGNGNCTIGQYTLLCQCNQGYTGNDCSRSMCPGNCTGHGSCVLTKDSVNGSCVCNTGWKGTNCETAFCPNNCTGSTCTSDGICICPSGDTTIDCSAGKSPTTDNIEVTPSTSSDNYDRNVFIGVLVLFTGVCSAAAGVLYYMRTHKKVLPDDE